MSENKTKKGRCSLRLKEAASYGAEPVQPVGKKIPNLVRKFLSD